MSWQESYTIRYRALSIVCLMTIMTMWSTVMAALWPEESFNACWQVLWDTFIS